MTMIYNDKMAQGITSPECREKEKKPCCGLNVRVFALILLCLVGILSPGVSGAQTSSNEAEWSGEGYSIKKVVSNTSIASGVNFSYTILFSAPAGVTTVSIQDLVPVPPLTIVSVTAAGPVLGVSPVIGFSNITGQVTYNLTSLPVNLGPPSGSFTIVVKFPEGVTCNGATARNRAEILVNDKWQGTPFVSTTATAVDPWVAGKTILSGAVVNPNGGTCGYLMNPGDTITYRLSVMKANGYYGNTVGQQNMTNAVVTDNLPAGASMVPTTNPCITYSGGTGGTITWNVNCPSQLLDAAVPWAYYFVDVKVVYPAAAFPVSSQVLNQVTLTGTTCNQQATHISNQTCIEVANVQPNAQATFQKYLSMTNRVPGCTGLYYIVFCNNGNVPLTAFDINDAVPSGITVNQVQIWGTNSTTTMDLNINNTPYATGINNYYNSGSIPSGVTNLQFQMTGSLPVGACLYLYVYFTVNPNPTGTIVTNCATFTPLSNALTLPQTCVSFTVDAGTPSPCLLKDICSPQSSYDPGDIVRFRLRVQNIGSANLTGASIQDLLHGNFTYVGNETYYQSSSYNPSCSTGGNPPAGATAWSGVTPSHSGNNLSWSLPVIPSDCQLFYAAYCGYYGTWGLPFYYIEFDAMVDSLAMPGVTPNVYTISGGNLVSPVQSNTVNILVAASFGQEVHKLLSTDNGASYASSGITTPGSTARFRLNYKNTSNVGVSSLRLVDLLALDASPGDKLILNRSINRGSQFDLSYTGNQATSLLPPGPAPTPSLFWASGEDICLPPYVVSSCATTSWGPTVDSNVRMDYGAFTLAPNLNLYEDFDVGIPVTAKNQEKVCNDFAAVASANFLLNGNPQTVTLTPVAAAPVCLTIDTAQVSVSCCDSIRIERAPGGDGVIGCCARMTATCPVDSVTISVSNGTIVSINSNCGPLPSGYAGQSTFTFATNGCIPDITTCVNPGQTGTVALNYHLVFSNGEKCDKRIILDCEAGTSHCCDSIRLEPAVSADGTDACCAKLTTTCEVKSIDVSVTNGTLASVSWNCSTPLPSGYAGQSSFTFAPGGCAVEMTTCVTPTQTGIVVINYIITFTNGEKCEKRIELDCKAVSCCENVKLTAVGDAEECCARLVTDCEVKSVEVKITNGTIGSAGWNCGPLPSGYAGQSSFTFTPGNCVLDLKLCVKPLQTGPVTISYFITFANGETCEKSITLDCTVTSTCCAVMDFKLKTKWPSWKTQIGSFHVVNADPTVSICYIEIYPSPAGTFTPGGLMVNGSPSAQSWTPARIPATGNFSQTSVNTVDFNLTATQYKGVITVCVVKCDGTRCCFDFKWNNGLVADVEIGIDKGSGNSGLKALSISPVVKTPIEGKIRYISFGFTDEKEIAEGTSEFFAISAASHDGDEYPADLEPVASGYMGRHMVFFELKEARNAAENFGRFNLVFRGILPKLGATLFDEEGNIIYSGTIAIPGADTLTSSLTIETENAQGMMFEFMNVYPNPSNGSFKLAYATGTPREVEVRLVTTTGQVLFSKLNPEKKAGIHHLTIDAGAISSGLYKVLLISEGETRSKSLVIQQR